MAKKVNYVFVGCGRIAGRHAQAIQSTSNSKLVAVCDLVEARAKELAQPYGIPHYTNYHAMMAAHPEADIVTIMTPSGMHAEHAADIMNRYRKNVVIEKPMVMTPAQGADLSRTAQKNGVRIFPIFQNRFNKAVQRVAAAMQSGGELGPLRVGTVRMRWCRPERYYKQSQWRGTWAMDGGALTNQGIHYIDILRYLCGDVKRVNSVLATLGAQIEVEDTAVATVEFKSGAVGVIEVMTSARDKDFEASVSCVCEKGLAVIAGIATNDLTTFSPDPAQQAAFSEEFPTVYGFGHDVMMQRISAAAQDGTAAPVEFEDAMKTIKLLHALYRSDEKREWVALDGAVDSSRLGTPDETLSDLYRTPAPDRVA